MSNNNINNQINNITKQFSPLLTTGGGGGVGGFYQGASSGLDNFSVFGKGSTNINELFAQRMSLNNNHNNMQQQEIEAQDNRNGNLKIENLSKCIVELKVKMDYLLNQMGVLQNILCNPQRMDELNYSNIRCKYEDPSLPNKLNLV